MYANIKKEVEEGKVLLEWDKTKGQPPVPLIKDKYVADRRKAKTMNFSLAYRQGLELFSERGKGSLRGLV